MTQWPKNKKTCTQCLSDQGSSQSLKKQLATRAAKPEWSLLVAHDLLADKPARTLQARLYRLLRRTLARFHLWPPYVTPYPWRVDLKHAPAADAHQILLIWAVGMDQDELRQFCGQIRQEIRKQQGVVPVLITDVADFAFFSRLGWLVEYVPELAGAKGSYREKKLGYLAWRYRDAMLVFARGDTTSEIRTQIKLDNT